MMKKLVRVFAYRKLKYDEHVDYDVAKGVDVSYAIIDEETNKAEIMSGDRKGLIVSPIEEHMDNNYFYMIMEEPSKDLDENLSQEEIIERTKKEVVGDYYFVIPDGIGSYILSECSNNRIIDSFENRSTPKLVRVFAYRKLKYDEHVDYDVAKGVDVSYAIIDEETKKAKIINGDRRGLIVPPIEEFMHNDYFYIVMDDPSKELDDSLSQRERIQLAKKEILDDYYFIYPDGVGSYGLSVCPNINIIHSFENHPSLSIERKIIDAAKEQKDQDLGLANDKSSDAKSYHILDMDIRSKYEELEGMIFGNKNKLREAFSDILKNISLVSSKLDSRMIRNLKRTLLLVGPSGSGKSFLIESIVKVLGLPYVFESLGNYVNTNRDIEEMLLNLYYAAGEDMDAFEHGIIVINGLNFQRRNYDIQYKLLSLLDGDAIRVHLNDGSSIVFDTSKITFIFVGNFLTKLVSHERVVKTTIDTDGLLPSLYERFNASIYFNTPSQNVLKRALIDPEYGYLKALNEYLSLFEISIEITPDIVDDILSRAAQIGDGYRGLSTALNNWLDEYIHGLNKGDFVSLVLERNQNN